MKTHNNIFFRDKLCKLILVFGVLLININCFSQVVYEAFENYQAHDIEKVYVSLNKPFYIPEDVIWGKVYVVDGRSHKLIEEEPIVHLDLVDPDGKIKTSLLVKTKKGAGFFEFDTNAYDKLGSYTLRAYTQYQLNFKSDYLFQKEIKLINQPDYIPQLQDSTDDYTMHFFPEGGYLIAGMQNSMAFKIESINKQSDVISGRIVNEKGELVTIFKTWNEGMGKLEITPELNKSYWAELEIHGETKRYKLPISLKSGYILKVERIGDDKIFINVKSNTENKFNNIKLLAHIRGQIVAFYNFDKEHHGLVVLERAKIPSGVVHLTLFDSEDRPVSERLVFNKNKNEHIDLEVNIDESVSKQSVVRGSIDIKGLNEITNCTSTISVYKTDILSKEIDDFNIVNYLLLQSDLRGEVFNPSQYFEEDNNRTRGLLDLLLMTHAWRRFSWQSVLSNESISFTFPKEYTTSVSGRILKKGKNKPIKADVGLNIINDKVVVALQQTTGDDGYFNFPDLYLPDKTDIMIQAVKYSKRKSKKLNEGEMKLVGNKNVDIEIIKSDILEFESTLTHYNSILDVDQPVLKRKAINLNTIPLIFKESGLSVNIEEVVIKDRQYSAASNSEAVKRRYKEKDIFFLSNSEKFLADDPQFEGITYNSIHEMLAIMVPSVNVTSTDGTLHLDGFRIALNGYLVPETHESSIDPKDVYSADMIVSPFADVIYGDSPVISLLTREAGDYKAKTPGVEHIIHPGYYSARDFYTPKYDSVKSNTDYRTAIFWDPAFELSDKTASPFKFRMSNLIGRHLIVVEGLTELGVPFTKKKYFNVKD